MQMKVHDPIVTIQKNQVVYTSQLLALGSTLVAWQKQVQTYSHHPSQGMFNWAKGAPIYDCLQDMTLVTIKLGFVISGSIDY